MNDPIIATPLPAELAGMPAIVSLLAAALAGKP